MVLRGRQPRQATGKLGKLGRRPDLQQLVAAGNRVQHRSQGQSAERLADRPRLGAVRRKRSSLARSAAVRWISIWLLRISATAWESAADNGCRSARRAAWRRSRRRSAYRPASAAASDRACNCFSSSFQIASRRPSSWAAAAFDAAAGATIFTACHGVALSCGLNQAPNRSAAACRAPPREGAPPGRAGLPRATASRKRRIALVIPSPGKSVHCFTTTTDSESAGACGLFLPPRPACRPCRRSTQPSRPLSRPRLHLQLDLAQAVVVAGADHDRQLRPRRRRTLRGRMDQLDHAAADRAAR